MVKETMETLPAPDSETQGFWNGCAAGELRLLRCVGCGTYVHEPAPMCHRCHGMTLDWARVSGKGRVYTWVVVHHAPGFSADVPYIVAVIELEEQVGLRIVAQIVDSAPSEIEAGMAVVVDFLEVSGEITLPVFRSLESGGDE